MLMKKIQGLRPGTIIPKPRATAEFKIKGWGKRRGEIALTYWIPNHKTPGTQLVKGVTVTEFKRAYEQLLVCTQLTRKWFNSNMEACANEGSCNFTTIGGIFQLLGIAHYASRGTYVLDCALVAEESTDDLNAMFDEILAEMREEDLAGTGDRIDRVMEQLDEEQRVKLDAALDELGKIFGFKKAADA